MFMKVPSIKTLEQISHFENPGGGDKSENRAHLLKLLECFECTLKLPATFFVIF